MWMLILEGLAIGTLLGLTGAGGGILAVPALMASQGWTVAQAAPVGLLAVTLAALVGTVEGLFKRIVRYRAALWIEQDELRHAPLHNRHRSKLHQATRLSTVTLHH